MAEKTFEPGTLDRTRKNIGTIDPKEAEEMQKKLGGEIIKERSVPTEIPTQKRRARSKVVRGTVSSGSTVSASRSSGSAAPSSAGAGQTAPKVRIPKSDSELPTALDSHSLKMIDALMMSPEYELKPNHGIFNVFFRMSAKNRKKLSHSFGAYRIKSNLDHMQSFISTMKTFIQISPDTYKARIASETDLKFKLLRTVGKWTLFEMKSVGDTLIEQADNLTVAMMVPFVSATYKELLTVYYIGEQQVGLLIKDIFSDLTQYPSVNKEKVQNLAKQAITEWLYICDQIIRGMYPLLMRMCATEYVEYPKFFTAQVVQILKFVNLSKFDILTPEKKKEETEDEKEEKTEEEKKPAAEQPAAGQFDNLVKSGLKILEQLYPDAGFSNLETHPDMYPYFQPIYSFDDGFNMLNPKNGLQVTVVLIRIIEDLFQGCRNITFAIQGDDPLNEQTDTISEIFSDWSYYREDLFNKKYGDYLRQYVNTLYSQKDYSQTQFGKEAITNMLWRAKYYFFPSYKFSAPTLNKPTNDSKYKPINVRTTYLKKLFSGLVLRIDSSQVGKKPVLGITNPWNRYEFEVGNPTSKRLDVLLGAKRDDETTAANNANLLKYTLCVVSVLDWWINNPQSPAYQTDTNAIYRISEKDGAPEFSAPVRSDQNKLFADGVKAKKAQAAN